MTDLDHGLYRPPEDHEFLGNMSFGHCNSSIARSMPHTPPLHVTKGQQRVGAVGRV